MAFLKNVIWIRTLCLNLMFLWIQDTTAAVSFTQSVDMAGQGCDEQTATQITDSDVVQVFARPPQLPSGGGGTRDSCTVELVTNNNRRIRIYILDIVIYDCGTFIKIFDTQQQMVKPRWTLDCKTKTRQKFISAYNRVFIKLEKLSAQSINFKYSLALTTSQGPDVEFEQAESNFRQEILTDGAIAGIGVAAAVVLLAIILIIIFLIVRLRKIRREEDEIAMSSKGGSTNGRSGTTFQSRHYSHSQDMSSIDSRDAPYTNGYRNGAYNDDSPNKEVKSILKTEKIEEKKVNKSPYIIRQSHRESTRSLDKPCLDDTDVSEGDYYSDSGKMKRDAERERRRSSRQRSKSSGHSDNERNETKDRETARSRTRSEKSRLQSENDKDSRSRSGDPLLTEKREREHHREHSNHRARGRDRDREREERDREDREREDREREDREREDREKERRHREREREREQEYEKERKREREYDSDDYVERGREKSREGNKHRNRSVSERRIDKQRERERSRSPSSRHGSTSGIGRSSSRPRTASSSSSKHQSQSQPDKYSSHSRHKTPSTGGRSDVSDGLRRERKGSERSGFNRSRTPSVGSRTDRNRSSLRRPRRQ